MAYSVRRVQEIGNSLYIALPREWVRRLGLSRGSLVRVAIDSRGALIVLPVNTESSESELSEITLDVSKYPNLTRAIVRSYLLGYNVIKVYSRDGVKPEHREAVSRACSTLLGLGVVDERYDTITLQVFTTMKVKLEELIRRINMISQSMYVDLYNTLRSPSRETLHTIMSRDETLDKLYFYAIRVIRSSMRGYGLDIEPIKLLTYRLLLRNIEEIGDNVKSAARILLNYMRVNSGIAFKVGEESMVFSDFVKRLTHLHSVAFKAVLSNDYAKAENCIIEYAVLKGMIGGLLKSCSKHTRIVMRRYRKILELVRDIADLV